MKTIHNSKAAHLDYNGDYGNWNIAQIYYNITAIYGDTPAIFDKCKEFFVVRMS